MNGYPYDASWPSKLEAEARNLRSLLPPDYLGRVEHFGSTAVPNLAAKPVVDILSEVQNLREVGRVVVPLLKPPTYEPQF